MTQFLIIGNDWKTELDTLCRRGGYIGNEIIALEVY